MCNCSPIPSNICTQCRGGNPCGCPPDYSVMPLPPDCKCCPPGYTYNGITVNYPNGVCEDSMGNTTSPIPCTPCVESVSADCVFLPRTSCLGGFPAGTSLWTVLEYLCSDAFIAYQLGKIGLNTNLGSGFCQLTNNCPAPSSAVIRVVSIIVTFP